MRRRRVRRRLRQIFQLQRSMPAPSLACGYAAIIILLVAPFAVPQLAQIARLSDEGARVADLREQRRIREEELSDILRRIEQAETQLNAGRLSPLLRDQEMARDRVVGALRRNGTIVESVTTLSGIDRDNRSPGFTAQGHGSFENVLAALLEVGALGGELALESLSLSNAVAAPGALAIDLAIRFEEPFVLSKECSAEGRLKNNATGPAS